MKILVTGAGGQLGNAFQEILPSKHEFVAARHADLDITRLQDIGAFLDLHQPDWVFNAAAYNQVDRAEQDREGAFLLNEQGPRNLAQASAERGIGLVHVSTDYVFDGTLGRPYTEEDRPNPQSVYGASKLAGEQAVAAFNPRHLIVRTAWLYSETGANFPRTMMRLAAQGPVRVVCDQFGSPTYALHLAAGILELVERDAQGLYHLAGSGGTSWHGLTVALFQRLGITVPVTAIPASEFSRPAKRPAFSILETCREPEVRLPSWEQGLDLFVSRIKKQTEMK